MYYLEDLTVGQRWRLGQHPLTREEIVDFARRFDPQPFHLSEEAAATGPFGGLTASGWHTASIAMRLAVDGLVHQLDSRGSPGVDELRWLVPVRPGDVLRLEVEVIEVRPSESRPDRGRANFLFEVYNQKDEVVMRMKSPGIIGRRPRG